MALRRIRETIATSRKLSSVSAEAFRLWVLMIVQTDDYGIYVAHPSVILGRCFPLAMHKVSADDICKWMRELIDAQLIQVYRVDGKWYARYVRFLGHNPHRSKSSTYPGPEGKKLTSKDTGNVMKKWDIKKHLVTHANKCERMLDCPYLVQ